MGEAKLADIVLETAVPRLHITPSTMDLSGLELEIANERDRAYRLRNAILSLPDAASAEAGRWAMGGRVSIGERLFVTDRFMVRAGVSELIYAGRVRGQGEIERKLSFEGGVAWLFGGR